MARIYHITTRTAWKQALTQGAYTADTLTAEGFIHCSTGEQVEGTLNRYFSGRSDLLLLEVDPEKLVAPLRYESAHGELYPHIYGPIPTDAVVATRELTPTNDGSFRLERSMISL